MSGIQTRCDAGCQKPFSFADFDHARLDDGVEKTYFTCPHCHHEYVAFYTDSEIRRLQLRMRRRTVESKNVDSLQQEIKVKMDALRSKIECKTGAK